MRARVFVTLKPSVFDPAGQDDRGRPALARLRRRRRTSGKASTSSSTWPPTEAGAGESAGCGGRRQGAGESGHRELSHRGGLTCDLASSCSPAATATRTRITPQAIVFGQDAEYLWHKDTDLKGADVVILPGGFAHGDYLRTGAMARFSPHHARGRRLRRPRRSRARHLQRISDSARSGSAAGRDAAQPRPEVPAASTSTCASSRPIRRSRRGASRPGAADSDRPRRRQLLRAAGHDRAARGQSPGRASATPIRRAGSDDACESQRVGCMRSPASATRRATSSA